MIKIDDLMSNYSFFLPIEHYKVFLVNTTYKVCKGLRRTNLGSWGGGWGGLHFSVVEK